MATETTTTTTAENLTTLQRVRSRQHCDSAEMEALWREGLLERRAESYPPCYYRWVYWLSLEGLLALDGPDSHKNLRRVWPSYIWEVRASALAGLSREEIAAYACRARGDRRHGGLTCRQANEYAAELRRIDETWAAA